MATYEFHCRKCNTTITTMHKIGDAVAYPSCPECQEQMVRLYNFGSVSFKGAGFYSTDKR
jgi:putative FmdB family regulatory protein